LLTINNTINSLEHVLINKKVTVSSTVTTKTFISAR